MWKYESPEEHGQGCYSSSSDISNPLQWKLKSQGPFFFFPGNGMEAHHEDIPPEIKGDAGYTNLFFRFNNRISQQRQALETKLQKMIKYL